MVMDIPHSYQAGDSMQAWAERSTRNAYVDPYNIDDEGNWGLLPHDLPERDVFIEGTRVPWRVRTRITKVPEICVFNFKDRIYGEVVNGDFSSVNFRAFFTGS